MPYFALILSLLLGLAVNAQNWALIWEDDFNSETLNTNYSSHDIVSQFNLYDWFKSELQ